MKILFLQDDFPPQSFGGAGISTYELAVSMKEMGHEVFVITTCRKKEDSGEFNQDSLKVFRIQSNYHERWRSYLSIHNPLVTSKVRKIIKQINPDITHINNVHYYLSYYCFKIAKRYSKGVVFTVRDLMTFSFLKLSNRQALDKFNYRLSWHDQFLQARKRWNPFRNLFIKKYLRFADRIFAISKALKEALSQNGIKRVSVIYNGIDIEKWRLDEDKVKDFKERYKLNNKKVVLFAGRLSSDKGGEQVIKSFALTLGENPDSVLLVVGREDAYAEEMKKRAKQIGIEEQLIFTGWIGRDEIKIAYFASDVVLMPSIYFDAFGRINIEAMAARKPVIGTCYGGTPEVVLDGVTGYIVNPYEIEKMSKKISSLIKNPDLANKIGEAGYERAVNNFELKDVVSKYLFVYNELIKNS